MTELKLVESQPKAWEINPNLKVAVVGFASSSRMQAPFQDPAWKIWGLNSLYALIPKFDAWFEIHPKDYLKLDLKRAELQASGTDHHTWLTEQPGPDGKCSVVKNGVPCECQSGDAEKLHAFKPIYMQEHYPEIPASVRWPRAEINAWTAEHLGANAEIDYFTSTPGEMVATAIYMGAGEIAVYGVDLLQDEEYAYQRPGCEYWLGVARGLGIKVTVPVSSVMLKANYVYGFTEPPTNAKAAQPMVDFWKRQEQFLETEQHRVAGMVNTWQGGRQAFTFVQEKLKAVPEGSELGAVLGELLAEIQKQLEHLEQQCKIGMESLMKMGGQRELANSGAAWTAAHGRGDKLPGMM